MKLTDKQKNGKWVVLAVDRALDGVDNPVHTAMLVDGFEQARALARKRAEDCLKEYNAWLESKRDTLKYYNGLSTFDEAWTTVDRSDGLEVAYGFEPVDNEVAPFAIMALPVEEEITEDRALER